MAGLVFFVSSVEVSSSFADVDEALAFAWNLVDTWLLVLGFLVFVQKDE